MPRVEWFFLCETSPQKLCVWQHNHWLLLLKTATATLKKNAQNAFQILPSKKMRLLHFEKNLLETQIKVFIGWFSPPFYIAQNS